MNKHIGEIKTKSNRKITIYTLRSLQASDESLGSGGSTCGGSLTITLWFPRPHVANCGKERSFHFMEGPVLIRASSPARQSHRIAARAASSRTSGERCSETSGRRPRAAWLNCNCASTIVAELRNHTALERRRAPTLSYSDFQVKPSAQGRGRD